MSIRDLALFSLYYSLVQSAATPSAEAQLVRFKVQAWCISIIHGACLHLLCKPCWQKRELMAGRGQQQNALQNSFSRQKLNATWPRSFFFSFFCAIYYGWNATLFRAWKVCAAFGSCQCFTKLIIFIASACGAIFSPKQTENAWQHLGKVTRHQWQGLALSQNRKSRN